MHYQYVRVHYTMQLGQIKNSPYETVVALLRREGISSIDWYLYCLHRGYMDRPKWTGKAVADYRKLQNLTQFELATVLRTDATTIARWEKRPNEAIPPQVSSLMALIEKIGLRTYLMLEVGETQTINESTLGEKIKTEAKERDVVPYVTAIKELAKQIKDSSAARKRLPREQISPDRIKTIRQAYVMSREEFASFLDVATSTIEKWESGASQPTGPSNILLRLLEQDLQKSFCLEEHLILLDRYNKADLTDLTQTPGHVD